MSQTNVDYLFQVIGLVGDRTTSGVPRSEEWRPDFGNQLSQASASTLNETSKTARRDDTRSARADDHRRSDSASDEADRRPAETSASEPAATTSASNHADSDADDAHSDDEAYGDNEDSAVNGSSDTSASADELDGADADDETNEDADGDITDAATAVAEAAAGQIVAAAAITESSPALENAVDTAGQNESAEASGSELANGDSDPRRAATKLAAANVTEAALGPGFEAQGETDDTANLLNAGKLDKKSRSSGKSAATAKDDANSARGAYAETISGTEHNGDASTSADGAQLSFKQSQADELQNQHGKTDEPVGASEESGRGTTGSSASRARGDAAAASTKVASASVANVVMTQPQNGNAKVQASDATQATKPVAANGEGIAAASGRLQANHGAAKRGARADGAEDTPHVDAARFVGRVAKAFHTAQERGGTLQLRLSPPELGSLRLELTVKDGVMTAALETETASARKVLLDHLPALRDRLAEQNIRVERFDVDVRRDGTGGQPDPRAFQDQQQSQQGHSEPRRQHSTPQRASEPTMSAPIMQPPGHNSGINLVA